MLAFYCLEKLKLWNFLRSERFKELTLFIRSWGFNYELIWVTLTTYAYPYPWGVPCNERIVESPSLLRPNKADSIPAFSTVNRF